MHLHLLYMALGLALGVLTGMAAIGLIIVIRERRPQGVGAGSARGPRCVDWRVAWADRHGARVPPGRRGTVMAEEAAEDATGRGESPFLVRRERG
jgi:hypothetical protein